MLALMKFIKPILILAAILITALGVFLALSAVYFLCRSLIKKVRKQLLIRRAKNLGLGYIEGECLDELQKRVDQKAKEIRQEISSL